MKKFALTTKMGETISIILCDCLDEAIELFSMRKHIEPEDLIQIYDVREV